MKKIIYLSIVALALVGFFIWFFSDKPETAPDNTQVLGDNSVQTFQNLTGEMLERDQAQKRPLAIVIENYPDARPQSGLNQADIVYETLAEGGITRFLAIYQSKTSEKLGPVRSARPYFAEIAQEYKAIFAHVGGSDEVLADIKNNKYPNILDANEYYLEKYFNRISSRAAPHNVYTSTQKLYEYLSRSETPILSDIPVWKYGELNTSQASSTPVDYINADFSLPEYKVRFDYDSATDSYLRSLAGKPHKDAESKQQLSSKNVIVMMAPIADIPNDPKLRVTINLNGNGKAYIFRNHSMIEGTWQKNNGRTNFYGPSGEEVTLAQGNTWVMIMDSDQPERLTTGTNPN